MLDEFRYTRSSRSCSGSNSDNIATRVVDNPNPFHSSRARTASILPTLLLWRTMVGRCSPRLSIGCPVAWVASIRRWIWAHSSPCSLSTCHLNDTTSRDLQVLLQHPPFSRSTTSNTLRISRCMRITAVLLPLQPLLNHRTIRRRLQAMTTIIIIMGKRWLLRMLLKLRLL